mmetsp:Transcript_12884/g.25005  ORF Transcript_12884/g.25005 Transcript_12884/m.25005 type:complete len:589 (+) Transcript_12884:217-1983(+)|eukprot:CAMPEP_0171492796 /NCGR_PEP_ID=MMETSP0958-20121227/4610_1 /TAXON_ID=87120 /ORGANISM="Aurantiochytrium limacinum, Strain ATCCMYA-1381" /LENGTH=588 /DNA_ID=CAMNT_0012026357 /DNA_START=259 /DNA_END=2025 /DNA_ORIENTATION=-
MTSKVQELVDQAEAAESEGLFQEAFEALQEAVRISKPQGRSGAAGASKDQAQDRFIAQLAYCSFAVRVSLQSLEPEDVMQVDAMLKECCNARQIADDHQLSAAFGLRGVILSQAIGDFQTAMECFQQSLALNGANCDSLYCMASVLDEVLDEKEEAAKLYTKLLALQPDNVAVMNNFSTLLIEKSRKASPQDRAEALHQAKQLLRRAQDEAPGFPAYNLACIAAQEAANAENDDQKSLACRDCSSWLKVAQRTGGIPEASMLEEDEDLESVRQEDWFKQAIVQAKHPDCFVTTFAGDCILLKEPSGGVCSNSDETMATNGPTTVSDDEVMVDVNVNDNNDKNGEQAAAKPINRGEEIEGTTGWTIWNASYVLLRWLEADLNGKMPEGYLSVSGSQGAAWWKGKRVLDLSAGLGLLGIACAKMGANVVLTDVGSKQVKTMQENVALNGFGTEQVVCAPLAWGDEEAYNEIVTRYGPFDVVLASDLVYIAIRDKLFEPFAATIRQIVQEPATQLILGFEERQARAEREFFNELQKYVTMESHRVAEPEFLYDIRETNEEENITSAFAGLVMHEEPEFILASIRGSTSGSE